MVPQKIGRWISTPCTRGRTGFFPWATRSTTRGAGYTGKARMEASGSHFSRLRSLPSLVPVQGDNTVGQLAVCQPASHFRERDACVRASVDDEPWRAEKDPTMPAVRQSRPRSRPARHETAHPPPPPRHPPPSTRPAEPRRDKPGRASRACTPKSPTFSSASVVPHPSAVRGRRRRRRGGCGCASAAVDASIGWPVAKQGFAQSLLLLPLPIHQPTRFHLEAGTEIRNKYDPATAIGNLHTPTTRQWLS